MELPQATAMAPRRQRWLQEKSDHIPAWELLELRYLFYVTFNISYKYFRFKPNMADQKMVFMLLIQTKWASTGSRKPTPIYYSEQKLEWERPINNHHLCDWCNTNNWFTYRVDWLRNYHRFYSTETLRWCSELYNFIGRKFEEKIQKILNIFLLNDFFFFFDL